MIQLAEIIRELIMISERLWFNNSMICSYMSCWDLHQQYGILNLFFGSQSHVCDKTRRCVSPFHYQAQNLPSFLFCLCTWCLKHYWSQQFAGGMSYITIVINQVTVESLQLSGRVSECRIQRSEVQMLTEHQNFYLPTLMTRSKKCLFLYFGFPICVLQM